MRKWNSSSIENWVVIYMTKNFDQTKSMDYQAFILLLSCLLPFIYALTISSRRNSRLPPGPHGFPIIGNLLEIGVNPHQSLAILSERYGALMSLKLGSTTTIVVSSPDIAKECLQTHDISFCNRFVPNGLRGGDYDQHSIVWMPAGDRWRKLRRISKEYLFSSQQLDASELLRRQKVQELVNHVNQCCTDGKALSIGGASFTTTLNILSNFMFSMDLAQYGSDSTQEFKDAVSRLMETAGKPSLLDLFPILNLLDPLGLLRPENVNSKKLLTIFDKIINERLKTRSTLSPYGDVSTINKDALDLLLDLNLKDESGFSHNDMRHLFLSLFIAGADTTSIMLEWAMSELIRNPEKMDIAKSEIDKLMKNNNKIIQESDMSQLPYLQAVIKETLRLHPATPFIPRQATNDVEVEGFVVPNNAQILCNIWAMGRDPSIWSDPEMFMPERFLGLKMDYKGQDFELIPFGAGRRICPGLNLANRMLHIILGSLIYNFDWKVVGNTSPQDIDMREKLAITLHKVVPLMVIPMKR